MEEGGICQQFINRAKINRAKINRANEDDGGLKEVNNEDVYGIPI